MSQQRTLLTQSEINALNAVINVIKANLNTHVNDSLSRAHGINGQFATYTDSAGDTVGNIVLYFDFGTPPNVKRLYVPATITNLGPSRTTGGVNVTATTATGSSTSPGVPLTGVPLATVFTEDATNNLNIYNDLLLAHISGIEADTGDLQVHGGIAFTVANTLDSLSHSVGNFLITLGINGTAFNLVAADGPGGPPQPPRVQPFPQSFFQVNHGWTSGFGFLTIITGGGSSIINPPGQFSNDYNFVVTPSVAPSGCTFKWQYFLGGTFTTHDIPNDTFTSIPFVQHPDSRLQVYVNSFDGSIFFMSGWVGGDTTDFVLVQLTVSDVAASTHLAVNGAPLQFTFVVSNHTRCCWFASQANITRRLDDSEWQMMGAVEQSIFKNNRRMVAFYIKHGEELLNRMKAAGHPQVWYEEFTDRVLRLIQENRLDDACDYYISNIIEMAQAYWPECDHPGLKSTIDARRLR
jgi:hypothetical protein